MERKTRTPQHMTLKTILATLLLVWTIAANGAVPPRKQLLNDRWQFVLNDSDFTQARPITLPHDWSIEQPFSVTAPAGNEGGYLPTGKGWYRRTLTLGKAYRGKKLRLYFEGVYMNSRVYVNGHAAGGWPYGYSSFWVDITPYAHEGNNEIVVSVDNSSQKNCRWYSGSGIYRNVWLRRVPAVSVEPTGFKIIANADGHIEIEALVENTLMMMMSESAKAFEKLPIIQDVDILRNIIYSGVWLKFEAAKKKREEMEEAGR